MKRMTKLMTIILVTGMLALTITSLASAKEVIEVREAGGKGYSYMIMAYNIYNQTYYTVSGHILSDAHKILIPKGWACFMTVMGPGMSVGTRDLYAKQDDFNPIFEVRKLSQDKLELVRVGYGPETMSSSGDGPFERKPPQ